MKITLKDIADDTGYAISTISRVLRGSEKISIETQEKVLSSAEKLGYKIPRNGDNKSKGYLNIALVASGFHEGEFYSSYFNGLNIAAANQNSRLFLFAVLNHKKGLKKLLRELSYDYFDGFVLFIPELQRHDYEKLASVVSSKFPIISNSLIEDPVFPTVTFDSYSGGFLAAKHFQNQGYKKVGIILGPENRSESRFRKNGFVDYIDQRNDMQITWVCSGNYEFEAGVEAFLKFKELKEKPEAVFASNDTMAAAFLETAKKYNFKIPEDVALLGYDDLPHNMYTHPTLSSVHTDYEKLGNATIKALFDCLSDNNIKANLLSFVPVSISHKESS
ncbi:MAG: LacI family transcriptional regulator [Balneolaceae bacterium]|nr:LacI family DNA-binding transcriptional regulator [Balneolaceae bacterium]TVR17957.1 MAG: LacI family transcriptional regulator [Balneolaceae bacterium]